MTLDDFVDLFTRLRAVPALMLMEYVDAPEITVDLFADKGEVVFHQTRTREEFLTGLAMAFKTIDRPELVELTRKVVRHLDLDYYQSVQWIGGRLLEINPRVSTFVYQEDFIIPYLGHQVRARRADDGRRRRDPGARAHHAPLGALLRPGLLGRRDRATGPERAACTSSS